MHLLTCASNEDTNQHAQLRSLIRVFDVRMKKLCALGCPKNAPRKDSYQTARTRRLIWIFAGCTFPKLRFSWAHISEVTFLLGAHFRSYVFAGRTFPKLRFCWAHISEVTFSDVAGSLCFFACLFFRHTKLWILYTTYVWKTFQQSKLVRWVLRICPKYSDRNRSKQSRHGSGLAYIQGLHRSPNIHQFENTLAKSKLDLFKF